MVEDGPQLKREKKCWKATDVQRTGTGTAAWGFPKTGLMSGGVTKDKARSLFSWQRTLLLPGN